MQLIPPSGASVVPMRFALVSEAQFIREHLECGVVRELAMRINATGIATLRATLTLQELAHKAHDLEGFYTLDERLHEQFCDIAERHGVWRVIKYSRAHLERIRWLSLPVAERVPHLIAQHWAIVDAVAQHEPDIAEASLRVHLREVYRTIQQLELCSEANSPG